MEDLRVLIVSDEKDVIEQVFRAADALSQATVAIAEDLESAKRVLEASIIDLALIDLAIESGRGVDLMIAIRHAFPGLTILAITDMKLQEYDREAIKLGVDGFIVQPIRYEHVQFQILHAGEVRRIREQYAQLKESVNAPPEFEDLIGSSTEMKQVFELVRRAAASSAPVSLYGESGTGKELVAKAIHRRSRRRDRPFVSINPAAIPETLLESELFGHARGAFTGAVSDRMGYVEQAKDGTLFLDEIGDLPLSFQGKLLRLLQEKSLHRVGSTQLIPVDFRLVTATNKDLLAEVHAGRFREDLFYRIHVFPIFLPPLRNRRGDIPLLAEYFLKRYGSESGRSIPGFAPAASEMLTTHAWPGNVRELENFIHRLVAMKTDDTAISPAHLAGLLNLPAAMMKPGDRGFPGFPVEIRPLDEHVRAYVRWVYKQLGDNKARAARVLDIDRATLHRKLQDEKS